MAATAGDFGMMDATAMAALVREGKVSAVELVDDAIRRCEQVNPVLNAVIIDMFDRAREAARQPFGRWAACRCAISDEGLCCRDRRRAVYRRQCLSRRLYPETGQRNLSALSRCRFDHHWQDQLAGVCDWRDHGAAAVRQDA